MQQSPAQIGVIPIDWNIWRNHNSVTPFYENLVTNQEVTSVAKTSLKQQLLITTAAQRKTLLIEQITQEVANILGIKDLNTIDLDLGFSELGLDSLGSVELRNKLKSSYDIQLPATVIFDYSNIQVLADYLLTLLFSNNSEQEIIEAASDNVNVIEVEELSEAEAEALLLEKLEDFNF